jgi:hypothetical protein
MPSKVDFIAIARAIFIQCSSVAERKALAMVLAEHFAKRNVRFSVDRFVNACVEGV